MYPAYPHGVFAGHTMEQGEDPCWRCRLVMGHCAGASGDNGVNAISGIDADPCWSAGPSA